MTERDLKDLYYNVGYTARHKYGEIFPVRYQERFETLAMARVYISSLERTEDYEISDIILYIVEVYENHTTIWEIEEWPKFFGRIILFLIRDRDYSRSSAQIIFVIIWLFQSD